MVGPDWPTGGEIDILEGVNEQTNNGMTLHTAPNCKIGPDTSIFAGEVTTPDCDVNAKNQSKNVGCSIEHPSTNSYGVGLNEIGGGVYATQWTAEAISVYYFPRGSIPDDVLGDAPNPDGWGLPAAKFTGGCDIENMFQEQQIIFNTAFCGDWAGAVWESGSCAKKAATCDDYVQNNPEAFKDAYWTINALKVYQDNGNDTPAPSPSGAPVQSTVVSEPVSVPTGNATEPAVSSGYATIPTEIPTRTALTSYQQSLPPESSPLRPAHQSPRQRHPTAYRPRRPSHPLRHRRAQGIQSRQHPQLLPPQRLQHLPSPLTPSETTACQASSGLNPVTRHRKTPHKQPTHPPRPRRLRQAI
jgi:hypothetical protein